MMTDPASLLFAPTAQPGTAAPLSASGRAVSTAGVGVVTLIAGLNSTDLSAVASGTSAAAPTTAAATANATAFQSVLASVQVQAPIVQPAPIKPLSVGFSDQPTPAAADDTFTTPTLANASTAVAAPVPALASQPIAEQAKATTVAPKASPAAAQFAIGLPDTPPPAARGFEPPTPEPKAVIAPETLTPTRPRTTIAIALDANGKLPTDGNLLPVDPTPTARAAAAQANGAVATGDVADDANDEKSTDPIVTPDLSAQPLLALVAGVAPPLPSVAISSATAPTLPSAAAQPIVPATAAAQHTADASSSRSITPGTIAPSDTPPREPFSPVALAAAPKPASAASAAGARTAVAAAQPALSAAAAPPAITIAAPSTLLAQFTPVTVAQPVAVTQSAPASATSAAAAPLQPAVVKLAAPALANWVPASPPPAGLSTASRLARQPGVSRSADPSVPTEDTADAASALTALPVTSSAIDTPTGITSATATPPQDFAALVDRLLEARATAQGATAPQQISTSVTHADFGKVSLTFQQDPAGLSVSMTSADPGFAPAAQSAMDTSGKASASRNATADPLSNGHTSGPNSAGNQNPAGGFSQGIAQPGAPAPANPGATVLNASLSTAGGGSQQSQSQGQAQPQQRPGSIAANRSPAAPGNGTGAAAATGQGIFA